MEVRLGDKVKCTLTGFKGIVAAITTFEHTCKRITVTPPMDSENGKMRNSYDIDETQLKVIGKSKANVMPSPKQVVFLGDKVKDPVSGYEGIAHGRSVYINGCARILVYPKHDKSREELDTGVWFPETQLIVTKKTKIKTEPKSNGGPLHHISNRFS